MQDIVIHWFRRDLRWKDNVALSQALAQDLPVLPIFIFDTTILNDLTDKSDKRVDFIHQQLQKLQQDLVKKGSSLLVLHGKPIAIWQQLLQAYNIKMVFTNRDYEPYAQTRDKAIYALLSNHNIPFKGYKDHVVFDKNEVVKKDGTPYTVFTPYSRKWKAAYQDNTPIIYPSALQQANFYQCPLFPIPSLESLGFEPTNAIFPSATIDKSILEDYENNRDFPAKNGTSKLSIHFRFGTISIRKMAKIAYETSEKWLNELIWRDFYQMIIYHFPKVVTNAFKTKYDTIPWRNNEEEFEKWCVGKTGYPMVDAGMRELNETGFMHNRVRMITASFLTKHLLIDWKWGEAYFAQKLLDFDLASNNGGWQWAASTGCDAVPYFRIFNPTSQLKKFDKDYQYIKKWIPEYGTPAYPTPIVDHKFARERAIKVFKAL